MKFHLTSYSVATPAVSSVTASLPIASEPQLHVEAPKLAPPPQLTSAPVAAPQSVSSLSALPTAAAPASQPAPIGSQANFQSFNQAAFPQTSFHQAAPISQQASQILAAPQNTQAAPAAQPQQSAQVGTNGQALAGFPQQVLPGMDPSQLEAGGWPNPMMFAPPYMPYYDVSRSVAFSLNNYLSSPIILTQLEALAVSGIHVCALMLSHFIVPDRSVGQQAPAGFAAGQESKPAVSQHETPFSARLLNFLPGRTSS